MCGADLSDGVSDQVIRCYAERLDQPEERDLDGEQRGLRELGGVEQILVGAPHDVAQRTEQVLVHLGDRGVEGGGEHGVGGVQLPAHAEPLRALAGKDERRLALCRGVAANRVGSQAVGDLGEPAQEGLAVGADRDGSVVERATPGQRPRHVGGVEIRMGAQVRQQSGGLRVDRGLGLRRQHQRDDQRLVGNGCVGN